MQNTTLQIIKNIKNRHLTFFIFISIILTPHSKVIAKEITNLSWKKSVFVGKKLSNFRETVSYPALGKKAWKITLLPKDCGRDREGDYSDCKNNGRDPVVEHGGGDRARSEYYTPAKFIGEKWHSVSIFIPPDFKSAEPVSTSFFQIYERGEGPRMMLRPKNGVLSPRYFPVNGMDSGGVAHKYLWIKDMKGKWTTIIFHTKMSKNPDKGFMKMYVDDVLYNVFEGRTSFGGEHYNKFGIYHSWISRWNDKVNGKYPKQVIYFDNLFRTNKKEKLLKLIKK